MVPQPQAAGVEPTLKPAPMQSGAHDRRWPRLWSVLAALAVSAVLWALIYLVVSSAAGLIGGR